MWKLNTKLKCKPAESDYYYLWAHPFRQIGSHNPSIFLLFDIILNIINTYWLKPLQNLLVLISNTFFPNSILMGVLFFFSVLFTFVSIYQIVLIVIIWIIVVKSRIFLPMPFFQTLHPPLCVAECWVSEWRSGAALWEDNTQRLSTPASMTPPLAGLLDYQPFLCFRNLSGALRHTLITRLPPRLITEPPPRALVHDQLTWASVL